jgi:hypothetical protein
MLQDILSGNLPYLPNIFSMWQISTKQFLAIALLSGAASYVLVLILAGIRSLTIPITFGLLLVAGMFSNWFFKDYHLQSLSELQETLIFTVVGHIFASLVLLLAFRTERVR